MSQTIRVTLSYACFGLEVEDGIVTEAAPIARWAVGKRVEDVKAYWSRKSQLEDWEEIN